MSFIEKDRYAKIIEVLPILCVDVVVKNSKGEYLLLKRANEPLKGQWWVIGGRVVKGESLAQAAIRKIQEELGIQVEQVTPIGYYEDTAEINIFDADISRHSVSVVFSAMISDSQKITLDNQSSDWKYSSQLPKNFHLKSFK